MIVLGGFEKNRDSERVRAGKSLQSIHQIYGLLGFLSCRAFFEEETDESWENHRVFSVPEIALVHQELLLSPTSRFFFPFNVDVAVCEFETEAMWGAMPYSRLTNAFSLSYA